jgi:hypothetical protein
MIHWQLAIVGIIFSADTNIPAASFAGKLMH